MTKEVEDIIRNKAYYELTSGERESVGEYAQNEEEYNNMQWFLTGTTAAFGGAKIEASPGLKKGVMEHLTEEKKKKGFWLNSVGLFMLPTNKRFYQKPAFQLGIAAALVVGLVFVLNPGVDDNGLAYVDPVNETPVGLVETIQPSETVEQDRVSEDLDDQSLNNQELEEQELAPAEREENEGIEIGNELTMDFGPVPEPSADEVAVFETVSEPAFAAPMIEEIEIMDMEDDISIDNYMGDDVADIVVKSDMDKDGSALEEKSIESLDSKENRRDKTKNNALRSISLKKEALRENKLSDSEPGDAGAAETGGVVTTAPTSTNASGYAENEEWIKPKAMHINKTKELNFLFFIEN
ncbi:MAG: hypothetical protein GQ574_07720 [Crocinitomix sp.]|nr:hypothetical protein [Crocinitomix sp.]